MLGFLPITLAPEAFAARLKVEHKRLRDLWREAGLKAQ